MWPPAARCDAGRRRSGSTWGQVRALFRHRQMWGLCIGPVRGLLDVRLLPHVVPDVPRHRAAHGLDPRRHLHRRCHAIAGFFGILFAGDGGQDPDAGPRQNAERRRAKLPVIARPGGSVHASRPPNYVENDWVVIARPVDRALSPRRCPRPAGPVISEVAPRSQLGLVSGLFSASAQPVGHRHAARDRSDPAGDGLVLRRAGVRGRSRAGRGAVLDLSDRRYPAD